MFLRLGFKTILFSIWILGIKILASVNVKNPSASTLGKKPLLLLLNQLKIIWNKSNLCYLPCLNIFDADVVVIGVIVVVFGFSINNVIC